jgi:hypothetical protein
MAQQRARRGRDNQAFQYTSSTLVAIWTRSADSHTGRRLCFYRIIGRTNDSIRPRAATTPTFPCLKGGVHRWKTVFR